MIGAVARLSNRHQPPCWLCRDHYVTRLTLRNGMGLIVPVNKRLYRDNKILNLRLTKGNSQINKILNKFIDIFSVITRNPWPSHSQFVIYSRHLRACPTNVNDVYIDCYTVVARWQWVCPWGRTHGLQFAGITFLWLVHLNIGWDCLVSHCIVGSRDRWQLPPFLDTTDSPFA